MGSKQSSSLPSTDPDPGIDPPRDPGHRTANEERRNQQISVEEELQYQRIIYEGLRNQQISVEEELQYRQIIYEELQNQQISGEQELHYLQQIIYEGLQNQKISGEEERQNLVFEEVEKLRVEVAVREENEANEEGISRQLDAEREEGVDGDKRTENEDEHGDDGDESGGEEVGESKDGRYRRYSYPVRPDAEDCSLYMRTGTCKFGSNCKFNHSPRRKNQYYLRPGGSKYGKACRYNHSRGKTPVAPIVDVNFLDLPVRLGEKECPYYMRNGSCKYGLNCRFNHPDPTAVGGGDAPSGYSNGGSFSSQVVSLSAVPTWSSPRAVNETVPFVPPTQGLPSPNGDQAPVYVAPHRRRLPTLEKGEKECPYYMHNGSCKYGSNCRFNHSDPTAVGGGDAPSGYGNGGSFSSQGVSLSAMPPWSSPRAVNETVPFVPPTQGLPSPNGDQAPVYVAPHQRRLPTLEEGEKECPYYMRNGSCKYGSNCRFNHPDPTAVGGGDAPSGYSNGGSFSSQGVSLSAMPPWSSPRAVNKTVPFVPPTQGLPSPNGDQAPVYVAPHRRRLPTLEEGEKECPYYMRNGSCKYGSNCRFNHPDPTAVGGGDAPSGYGNGGSFSSQGVSLSAMPPWLSPRAVNETVPFVPPTQGLPSPNGDQAPVYVAPHQRRLPTPPAFALNSAPETNCYMHHKQQMLVDEFPERPGQPHCTCYLKTGDCKYKSGCKYHHPKIQIPKTPTFALSDKGLLLRPDQNICSRYNRYGIYNFGPACKFDHPVSYCPSATSTGPGPGTGTPPSFGNPATTDGARMGRVEIGSETLMQRPV